MQKLLWKRKITTQGQFDKFFHPEKYESYDPFLFAEMDLAVARIKQAIERNEQILVYGDYDADGVTSIAVLMKTLRHLRPMLIFIFLIALRKVMARILPLLIWLKTKEQI